MSTLARFLPLAIATATAFAAGVGYDNTPQIPGQKWKVHDKTRPNPPIVEPGESFSHQAPAPADAAIRCRAAAIADPARCSIARSNRTLCPEASGTTRPCDSSYDRGFG